MTQTPWELCFVGRLLRSATKRWSWAERSGDPTTPCNVDAIHVREVALAKDMRKTADIAVPR